MQVTSTTTAVKGTLPLNAAASGAAVPSQDFLSAINAGYSLMDSSDIPIPEEERPTAEEIAPVERYQAITGRNVTESDPDLDIPSYWNDETLSHFVAGQFTGNWDYPMDTSKTINWQSRGDHELTAEEIAQLKEKYDVNNLSAQEYYDLMSDLTHMGVLSGGDVMGVHLATVGSAGQGLLGGMRETGIFSGGRTTVQGTDQGNAVNYFAAMLSRVLESWEWINSDEYKLTNSHLSAEKQELIHNATLKDLQPRQKMLDVLTQLQ